jgi:hypothetical protein
MAAGGLTMAGGITWWISLSPNPTDERSGLLGVRGQF